MKTVQQIEPIVRFTAMLHSCTVSRPGASQIISGTGTGRPGALPWLEHTKLLAERVPVSISKVKACKTSVSKTRKLTTSLVGHITGGFKSMNWGGDVRFSILHLVFKAKPVWWGKYLQFHVYCFKRSFPRC
eukprot:1160962-Pelagomonas_calceolata.AAC.3